MISALSALSVTKIAVRDVSANLRNLKTRNRSIYRIKTQLKRKHKLRVAQQHKLYNLLHLLHFSKLRI
jgi:hypothetical protein